MNNWQISYQIKHLIEQINWSGGENLFRDSNIFIAPFDPYAVLDFQASYPLCIIRILDQRVGISNRNRVDEVTISIGIDIVTSVPGDKTGEGSLLGRNQKAGTIGKGLLEIEELLQSEIEKLTTKDGINFEFVAASAAGIDPLGDSGNEVSRRLTYNSRGTRQKTYHKPNRFRASESGGTITLTWINPDFRFDFTRVEVYRHTSEITSYGTGTLIYSGIGTSDTDSPGSGDWYYAAFGIFTEPGNATEQKSEPRSYRINVP